MSGLRVTGTRGDPRLPARKWANKEIYCNLFLFNFYSSFLNEAWFWGVPSSKIAISDIRWISNTVWNSIFENLPLERQNNAPPSSAGHLTFQLVRKINPLEFDDLFAMSCLWIKPDVSLPMRLHGMDRDRFFHSSAEHLISLLMVSIPLRLQFSATNVTWHALNPGSE
jgi:hypothetical protein